MVDRPTLTGFLCEELDNWYERCVLFDRELRCTILWSSLKLIEERDSRSKGRTGAVPYLSVLDSFLSSSNSFLSVAILLTI